MTWYEILTIVGVPSILSGIFMLVFAGVITHIEKGRKKKFEDETKKVLSDSAVRKGMQAILRDRLRQSYRYFSQQGWIDIADKDNFENMYQCYHNLGKNGVMDEIHKEVMSMPTKPPKNHESDDK